MAVTTDGIAGLAALARKLGIRRLRVGEVEMDLGPEPARPARTRKAKAEPEDESPEVDPVFDAVRE